MLTTSVLAFLPLALPRPQFASCSEIRPRVLHGQPGPEGGQLADSTLPYGAVLGSGGRVAFMGQITGLARNQAVMVSDGESLRAIAVGCGGAGGSGSPGSCGDPTPLGGTFAGFFTDPWYAPAIDAEGDVLFLADVFGGTTSRGLFLHRASTGAIESVAAVGQTSPSGNVITGLGAGSLDAGGTVTFLARTEPGPGGATEILTCDAGVLSVVAREGGQGPDGPYDVIGGEFQLFPDGTAVSAGPVPVRDPEGRFAFFAASFTSQVTGLVLVAPGQSPAWIARQYETTPAGGSFRTFGAPMFAPNGDVYFTAQYMYGNNNRAGWFAGSPGNLRAVLVSFDPIGTSTCYPLGRARNPFQAVGRSGELVTWAILQHSDMTFANAHVLVRPGGAREILAEEGGPAPTGGVIAELGLFPSIDTSGRILQSARVSGGAAANAAWLVDPCGAADAFCEGKPSSLGCEPRIHSTGRASATSTGVFHVSADSLPSHRSALLLYGPGAASTPYQGGTLCVAPPVRRTPVQTSTGPTPSDCSGTLLFDFGDRIRSGVDPALTAGASIAAQWLVRDPPDPLGLGTTLSDAVLFTIAP